MKLYDKLLDAGSGYVEYVVSVRTRGEGSGAWIPVAQLLVGTEELSTEIILKGMAVCSRWGSNLRPPRLRSKLTIYLEPEKPGKPENLKP